MIPVNTLSIFRGKDSMSKKLPVPETVEIDVFIDKETKEIVGIGSKGPQNIQLHIWDEENEIDMDSFGDKVR
tara:strand:- start:662 stop:877 length:216 start_codon:yes stop_codon:yes gene_type:complete